MELEVDVVRFVLGSHAQMARATPSLRRPAKVAERHLQVWRYRATGPPRIGHKGPDLVLPGTAQVLDENVAPARYRRADHEEVPKMLIRRSDWIRGNQVIEQGARVGLPPSSLSDKPFDLRVR